EGVIDLLRGRIARGIALDAGRRELAHDRCGFRSRDLVLRDRGRRVVDDLLQGTGGFADLHHRLITRAPQIGERFRPLLRRIRLEHFDDRAGDDEARVREPYLARTERAADAARPAGRLHRVMAGIAVEEDQLGEQAVILEAIAGEAVEKELRRSDLANGPHLHVRLEAFALAIVVIDLEVSGLAARVGVELEVDRQRRMSRAHDAVIDLLLVAAEVAVQADLRARRRLFERIETVGKVFLMGGAVDVRADPVLRAAVARLAGDAFGDLIPATALRLGHVIGVTGQALGGGFSALQAEIRGDPLAGRREQQLVGVRVRVLALPRQIFALQDVRIGRGMARAVAVAAGAARHAFVTILAFERQRRSGNGRRDEHGDDACRSDHALPQNLPPSRQLHANLTRIIRMQSRRVSRVGDRYRIAIVGSGPGGLSAACRAAEAGDSHVLLEAQPHLSNTIFRYQKGKHVMAEPNVLPLRAAARFDAGSREQILGVWDEDVAKRKVNVKHRAEVAKIEKSGEGFKLALKSGESVEADRVVLCIGVQGNPNKLGAPGEDLPYVQYQLDDPDEYKGETIVVVGAGDAAIENAVALARANKVHIVNRKG